MNIDLSKESFIREDPQIDGMMNLIAALFRLTAQDIHLGRQDARDFLDSEWFDDICYGIQVNPKVFKEYILNNKVKSRVSYE